MKRLAFILTIALITLISSVNGHAPLTGASFSNDTIFVRIRKTGNTYKIVADMNFGAAYTFKVTRLRSGSNAFIYVDLTSGGSSTGVSHYTLLNYDDFVAKATAYMLYMRTGSGTSMTTIATDGPIYAKGADTEL
ncbi:MAG TPA: hypothetical protein VE978_01350 [Chitinophagales bacterium]|nr:hypothetical protein [Chitinophagales bacterium]